jgi:hypothetical protein
MGFVVRMGYRIVVRASECPSIDYTKSTDSPAATASVAAVCRRSWRRMCDARPGVGRRAASKLRCLATNRFESEAPHDDRKFRRRTS